MSTFLARLPDANWLHRHRHKLGGFVAGAVLQLALAGLVATIFTGGLSDSAQPAPSVYQLY